MEKYCVNANIDDKGRHEVHFIEGCKTHLPDEKNRIYIDEDSDANAMIQANNHFNFDPNAVDGCFFCMNDYHKG